MQTTIATKAVISESTEKLDVGHIALCKDTSTLYREAMNWEFHDLKNGKYPVPKVALVGILETIIERAKNGEYDN